jgi:hypothetical protein
VNQSFITGITAVGALAVDGTEGASTIGRANRDGKVLDQSFLSVTGRLVSIAVAPIPEPATALRVMGGVLGRRGDPTQGGVIA